MTTPRMLLLAVAAIIGIIVVTGLASDRPASGERSAGDYVAEFGGNADDYSEILHELSCGWLRDRLDLATRHHIAAANGSAEQRAELGIMTAVQDRMAIVACRRPSDVPPASGMIRRARTAHALSSRASRVLFSHAD